MELDYSALGKEDETSGRLIDSNVRVTFFTSSKEMVLCFGVFQGKFDFIGVHSPVKNSEIPEYGKAWVRAMKFMEMNNLTPDDDWRTF